MCQRPCIPAVTPLHMEKFILLISSGLWKNEHFLFSFFGQVKLKTPTEEQSEERPY